MDPQKFVRLLTLLEIKMELILTKGEIYLLDAPKIPNSKVVRQQELVLKNPLNCLGDFISKIISIFQRNSSRIN